MNDINDFRIQNGFLMKYNGHDPEDLKLASELLTDLKNNLPWAVKIKSELLFLEFLDSIAK